MQELIILGLIPGTHIQINFTAWLYSTFGVFLLISIYASRAKIRTFLHSIMTALVTRQVLRMLTQYHLL